MKVASQLLHHARPLTKGIIFVDCETTGLDPDQHEIWELALIVDDEEHVWTVDVDLSKADPGALRVSRYYERLRERERKALASTPFEVATQVWYLTANRQLVGINPAFDAAFLTRFLRRHGSVPKWHYHVIDVKALAAGWLMGRHPKVPGSSPPWNTDDLARALHLNLEGFDRHTALGDARLAKAMYEAVMAS